MIFDQISLAPSTVIYLSKQIMILSSFKHYFSYMLRWERICHRQQYRSNHLTRHCRDYSRVIHLRIPINITISRSFVHHKFIFYAYISMIFQEMSLYLCRIDFPSRSNQINASWCVNSFITYQTNQCGIFSFCQVLVFL